MPTVNNGGRLFGSRPAARAQEGQCRCEKHRPFLSGSRPSVAWPLPDQAQEGNRKRCIEFSPVAALSLFKG
jgi:hypothetical protein